MESNIQRLRTQNLDRDVQDSDGKQQRRRNQKSRPLGRYNFKSRANMTPQEKAKELVNKMYNCDKSTPEESMAMLYPHAKQCALIAVEFAIEFAGGDMNEQFDKIIYLVEVKHEIEKI